MTNKKRFVRLYWFIRQYPKLRIRIHARAWNNKQRVHGRAHLYRRKPCLIELWLPPKPYAEEWAQLTATLIHEFGHCALRYVPHTEREAWCWGRRGVPNEVVPACWKPYKRKCLKSYPRRLRDKRWIGAFGRRWEWTKK